MAGTMSITAVPPTLGIPGRIVPYFSQEIREELQRFAESELREELSKLRSELQQDFRGELQDFHEKSKTARNSIDLGKRLLPPLRQPEEKPINSFRGTSAPWDFTNLPARSPAVHPMRTDTPKNDRLEEKDEHHAEGKKTVEPPIVEVPLPGRPPDTDDDAQPPPTNELRMLGDTQSGLVEGSRPAEHVDSRSQNPLTQIHESNAVGCSGTDLSRSNTLGDTMTAQASLLSNLPRATLTKSNSYMRSSTTGADSGQAMCHGNSSNGETKSIKSMAKLGVQDLEDLEVSTAHFRSRRYGTKMSTAAKFQKDTLLSRMCSAIGNVMEQFIMCVIILNGFLIGVQADYQARNVTESVPEVFRITEIIFFLIFTAEFVTKLLVYRHNFFIQRGWRWNVFDMLLVIFQLIEVVGMFASNHDGSGNNPVGNVSFLRLLRILRVMRILRLVRLLHFVGELATIISSIVNCVRALAGTVALLLMMIYVVGVLFTQIVFNHRVGENPDARDGDPDTPLAVWWGSLDRATLTLYQAILGGVDWETVSTPLKEISPVCVMIFCFYIAFSLLGMMNIITGSFVQSALKHSENEKAKDFRAAARSAFMHDGNTTVNFQDFVEKIEGQALKPWMQEMGIELQDARLLFRLQADNDDEVTTERIVASLISLRDGAKFIDIMKVLHELKYYRSQLDEWFDELRQAPGRSVRESQIEDPRLTTVLE